MTISEALASGKLHAGTRVLSNANEMGLHSEGVYSAVVVKIVGSLLYLKSDLPYMGCGCEICRRVITHASNLTAFIDVYTGGKLPKILTCGRHGLRYLESDGCRHCNSEVHSRKATAKNLREMREALAC